VVPGRLAFRPDRRGSAKAARAAVTTARRWPHARSSTCGRETREAAGRSPTFWRSPDAAAALRAAIARQGHPDFRAEALAQRLEHFLAEDGRVLPALRAFAEGDRAALGALAAASQRDAGTLLGNQIAETSALAAMAVESGAFAASSFGAGFGGSVWALADAGEAAALAARWRGQYVARFPHLAAARALSVRPAGAALEIDCRGWKFDP
jgi:galactokinase